MTGFQGTTLTIGTLPMAFYSGLWAYDGWYVILCYIIILDYLYSSIIIFITSMKMCVLQDRINFSLGRSKKPRKVHYFNYFFILLQVLFYILIICDFLQEYTAEHSYCSTIRHPDLFFDELIILVCFVNFRNNFCSCSSSCKYMEIDIIIFVIFVN